ncbi:N-acetylmuramoyl-L-alanine amidase [Actinomycetospora succinea]|uniref:N-acetylmuramoyl-L-alanine amidase n=1 Tax=Actinomycetospora succinea TaxID=663603 RepID=A0A4R6VQJ5_9PSEU|nr:N-acetylmuramoyl-L-alanine amidase [Actinomycetospora succinea]TDQ64774.1 N-acetylmuramoyl-L-alanine amidase [Actinomycetospora succinea]
MGRHQTLTPDERAVRKGRRRVLEVLVVGLLAAASLVLGVVSQEAPTPDGPGGGATAAPAPDPVAVDPAAFPAGGCVRLAPSGPGPAATVALDAGHGGPDPGSEGTTADGDVRREKDLTLAVTRAAAERLRARGTTVVLTRSTDALGTPLARGAVQDGALTTDASQLDLLGRVRCANVARADALVSVHFNSFADAEVGGTETLYEPERTFARQNRALAQSLQGAIRARLTAGGHTPLDRGIADDSSGAESGGGHLVLLGPRIPGYIDQPSAMPGALVEPLFLTNPDDLAAIAGPGGTDALGEAVATGVGDYLDGAQRR